MQPDSKRTPELMEAIIAHLQVVGPMKWNFVRDQFPEISPATFWRRVAAVRKRLAEAENEVGTLTPSHEINLVQPDPSNPGAVIDYFKDLRQAQRLKQLITDAEELKRQCVDRHGKITNLTMYAKSVVILKKLLDSETEMLERFFDLDQMSTYYQQIVDTISAASPEVSLKILIALDELHRCSGGSPSSTG